MKLQAISSFVFVLFLARISSSSITTENCSDCDNTTAGCGEECECPRGSYFSLSGAIGCTECESCGVGHFRQNCEGTTPGTCEACLPNTFKSWSGADQCAECESCPAGQFREGCGGTLSGNCKACPYGTFKQHEGKLACYSCSCPKGEFRPSCGDTHAEKCRQCPAGTFKASIDASRCLACNKCPPGEFRAGCGGASEGTCTPCAANGTASSGAEEDVQCTRCGSSCPAGQQRVGCDAFDFGTCEACLPGTFKPNDGPEPCQVCDPCGPEAYRSRCGGFFPGSCEAALVTLRAVARLSGIQAQALGSAAQAIFRAEIALVLAALPGAKKLAGHVNVIRVSDGTADSDTDEAELPAEEGGLAHLEYEVVGFEEVGELAAAAASLRSADAALVRQLRAYPEFASLVDVATEVMPWPSQPEDPQGEQTPRSSHTVTAAVIGSPSVIMIAVSCRPTSLHMRCVRGVDADGWMMGRAGLCGSDLPTEARAADKRFDADARERGGAQRHSHRGVPTPARSRRQSKECARLGSGGRGKRVSGRGAAEPAACVRGGAETASRAPSPARTRVLLPRARLVEQFHTACFHQHPVARLRMHTASF